MAGGVYVALVDLEPGYVGIVTVKVEVRKVVVMVVSQGLEVGAEE